MKHVSESLLSMGKSTYQMATPPKENGVFVANRNTTRTNTYLGPLVAEISHGGFRLLGRCCVVFCCWLSILKNTFILAAQREFFLKTEWLTPHAATENHSFCFITN